VSIAGLAKTLSKLHVSDRSESYLRKILTDANHSKFDEMKCTLSLPTTSGPDINVDYIDPFKLLVALINESPTVAASYAEAYRRSPPSVANKWHLVVGFDEFVPGNKLRVDHSRKTMVVSFTFRELGQAAVNNGMLWHTFATIRSDIIARAHDGTFRCVPHCRASD